MKSQISRVLRGFAVNCDRPAQEIYLDQPPLTTLRRLFNASESDQLFESYRVNQSQIDFLRKFCLDQTLNTDLEWYLEAEAAE